MYSVHVVYQLKMLQHEDPANQEKLLIKSFKCMLIHIHSCSMKMKHDSLLTNPNSKRLVNLVSMPFCMRRKGLGIQQNMTYCSSNGRVIDHNYSPVK